MSLKIRLSIFSIFQNIYFKKKLYFWSSLCLKLFFEAKTQDDCVKALCLQMFENKG